MYSVLAIIPHPDSAQEQSSKGLRLNSSTCMNMDLQRQLKTLNSDAIQRLIINQKAEEYEVMYLRYEELPSD